MTVGDGGMSHSYQKSQDPIGPDHTASATVTAIDGVNLVQFPQVPFAHGHISEIYNLSWSQMFGEPVEHMYFLSNLSRERQEWYEHKVTKDRYVLVQGELELALFDGRETSPTFRMFERLQMRGISTVHDEPHGIIIPPGVWHSLRNISDSTLIMNFKTPGYARMNPDKYRIEMPNELCDFNW